jgi:predicted nucleotidyltransferase
MADESVLSAVRNLLETVRVHRIPVELAVLFGSWFRERASPESDIDLLVVSPRFDAPRSRSDIAAHGRIAARVDSGIEPVPCGSRQWREDETSPLLAIAREEGEPVAS